MNLIRITKRAGNERGVTLLEMLVALAILGGAVLTIVLSVSGGALAVQENDREAVAQGLARTQLEAIKDAPYAAGYAPVSAPEGYGIAITVGGVPGGDGSIQKITVDIMLDRATILTVADYKVDR